MHGNNQFEADLKISAAWLRADYVNFRFRIVTLDPDLKQHRVDELVTVPFHCKISDLHMALESEISNLVLTNIFKETALRLGQFALSFTFMGTEANKCQCH